MHLSSSSFPVSIALFSKDISFSLSLVTAGVSSISLSLSVSIWCALPTSRTLTEWRERESKRETSIYFITSKITLTSKKRNDGIGYLKIQEACDTINGRRNSTPFEKYSFQPATNQRMASRFSCKSHPSLITLQFLLIMLTITSPIQLDSLFLPLSR